ncbi:hypothetical protein KUV47_07720 [Vannielia litorea]|uniref:hypothetical protein n=1 Tax=Vannielia TaxID=2813041 RepID=UPI001C98A0ED|nr:hypothetical protein [Vannielia litorea]MBY6046988.1 hypothetical protein [Vannielia litorea]MBY6074402.1 hypothetical protein [Vannielia litorea]MBY6153092.1 hypothetical protein [Vannielia litorea]
MDYDRTAKPEVETTAERVAVVCSDRILALDLQMMLSEAGYEVVEVPSYDALATPQSSVSSAVVDIGDKPEAAVTALLRLATANIPHVILSDEAQELPLSLSGEMLRGTLHKPIRVDELLPLLGQSVPPQRGVRRMP